MGFPKKIFGTWLVWTNKWPGIGMRPDVLCQLGGTIERLMAIAIGAVVGLVKVGRISGRGFGRDGSQRCGSAASGVMTIVCITRKVFLFLVGSIRT